MLAVFLYLKKVLVTASLRKSSTLPVTFDIYCLKGMTSTVFIDNKAAKVYITEAQNGTCIFKVKKLLFYYI